MASMQAAAFAAREQRNYSSMRNFAGAMAGLALVFILFQLIRRAGRGVTKQNPAASLSRYVPYYLSL